MHLAAVTNYLSEGGSERDARMRANLLVLLTFTKRYIFILMVLNSWHTITYTNASANNIDSKVGDDYDSDDDDGNPS